MTADVPKIGSVISRILICFICCNGAVAQELNSFALRPIPRTLFGMHVHRLAESTPWPSVPIGAMRLHDAEYVSWATIEPKPGKWDFRAFDKNVEACQERQVPIVYVFGQTPTWAAERKDAVSAYGIKGTSSPPADLEIWERYIRTVVRRYRGKITHYEVWNEASAPNFYSGSIARMIEMARVAYETIKREDPEAQVLSPSGTGDEGVKWFDSYLFAGGARYCDVLSYHFYHKGMKGEPEAMVYLVNQVRDSMKRYKIEKPLWDTECYYGPNSPTFSSPDAIGSVARSFLVRWALGIERFYWYSWDNFRGGFQMLDPELNLTKAARSYSQIQQWIVGTRMVRCYVNPDGIWEATFSDSSGKKLWIVWSPKGPKTLTGSMASTFQPLLGSEQKMPTSRHLRVDGLPVLLRP